MRTFASKIHSQSDPAVRDRARLMPFRADFSRRGLDPVGSEFAKARR
jgi:hypothetical protein